MRQDKHLTKLGFTLIELLLVITILGILAVFSVTYFQQRTTDIKITRTTATYQLLLQAAFNYYQNNGCWPNSTFCKSPVKSFSNYVPLGADTNAWQEEFNYGPISYTSGNTTYQPRFQVFSNGIPKAAAQQIATNLPNAIASCSDEICEVHAEISVPVQTVQSMLVTMIATIPNSIGKNTYTLPAFTCPSGWSGNIVPTLSAIKVDAADSGENSCTTSAGIPGTVGTGSYIIDYITNTHSCQYASGHFTCSLTVSSSAIYNKNTSGGLKCDSYGNRNLGKIDVTYIGYCLNPAAVYYPLSPPSG